MLESCSFFLGAEFLDLDFPKLFQKKNFISSNGLRVAKSQFIQQISLKF